MPFDLILFDLDGTLVDTADDIADALNLTLEGLSRPKVSRDVVVASIGSGVRALIDRTVGAPTEEVFHGFLRTYGRNLLNRTTLYPGVAETLPRLPGRKVVVSNKPTEMCRTILAGLGIADHFAAVYGRDALPVRKPDAEVIRRIRGEVDGDSPLLVGDSGTDVRTARNAGIPVVAVTYGYHCPGDLDEADYRIDRFGELIPICAPEAS